MGRRIKQPECVHRDNIASAAEHLFLLYGMEATTMDQIAKEAGYSKATLYVYFTNKEDIVGYLVLKSMNLLRSFIQDAVTGLGSAEEKYNRLCTAMMDYQQQYPLYFGLALGRINVDFEDGHYLPVEKDIYEVGEQINSLIGEFIRSGMDTGELRPDIPILQTAFLFWAAFAGIIQMADNKQLYLEKAMNLSKQQFLQYGFHMFYLLIAKEGKE